MFPVSSQNNELCVAATAVLLNARPCYAHGRAEECLIALFVCAHASPYGTRARTRLVQALEASKAPAIHVDHIAAFA